MLVNNQSLYAYYYGMNAYKATVGLATEFVVRRSFYTQYNAWPFDYSECMVDEHGKLLRPLDDPSLFKLVTAQSNSSYMRHVCYELCYQEGLANVCQCAQYNIKMQVRDNITLCLPPLYSECEQRFRETQFYTGDYFQAHCMSARVPQGAVGLHALHVLLSAVGGLCRAEAGDSHRAVEVARQSE